ncbi:META domain-containing protein [Motiliproteus sediminis]|uniref:META domain-containing protein n=1 Tax=Motiliproteus sediminis TaxID=1468178 RepID=UPI001AF02876|nr:META domain-containing protein [Motiliproteus sediminis]
MLHPLSVGRRLLTLCAGLLFLTACAPNDIRVSGSAVTPLDTPLGVGTVLEIKVQDTSLADAKAQTLATLAIEAPEANQPFSLDVPAKTVDSRHRYSVSARIIHEGRLLFITDRHYPVLTAGQDRQLKLQLVAVKPVPPAELVPTRWILSQLQGEPLPALERQPFMQLNAEEGRVNGHSGCNAFAGSARLGTPALQFGALMGTRMMCDPATMQVEDRMLQLLNKVAAWRITAGQLTLLNDQGQALMRFSAPAAEQ